METNLFAAVCQGFHILTMAGLSEFLFSLLHVDAGTDKMSFSLHI